jgi:hypothetical protein
MDAAAEGKTYPDVAFAVAAERVSAFRRIFSLPEEAGVPPTFVTAAEFSVLPTIIDDPDLDLDLRRVIHGTQEYVFARPLREGETVAVRARIESIRHKAGTGIVTIATDIVGADGTVACTARSTMVERGDD